MSILSHPLTFADLERDRETRDERLELIEGEIVVTPSPTPLHQFVSQRLYDLLKETVVSAGLGRVAYAPLDVFLDDTTVVQPDLIVLLHDKTALIGDLNIAGPPSLVMEITSPSTAHRDRGIKRDLYARFGVSEYWLIDLETRTATVYSVPRDGRYLRGESTSTVATSSIIPALVADIATLFAPI